MLINDNGRSHWLGSVVNFQDDFLFPLINPPDHNINRLDSKIAAGNDFGVSLVDVAI